jgi:hypothetical protein
MGLRTYCDDFSSSFLICKILEVLVQKKRPGRQFRKVRAYGLQPGSAGYGSFEREGLALL